MRPCNLNSAVKQVSQVHDASKLVLDELNKLQNDELFVSIDVTFNSNHVAREVNEWIFENDIVAKWQTFDFNVPDTESKFVVTGYKFRNVEDAMAFKVRWI